MLTYDNELITSIAATQAPTSPLNLNGQNLQEQKSHEQKARLLALQSLRQHQVLVAGTGSGSLKRIVLTSGDYGFGVKGVEFDQVQIDDQQQEPILADLHLMPTSVIPTNTATNANGNLHQHQDQFAIAATPYKVAKLRVNSCKVSAANLNHQRKSNQNSTTSTTTVVGGSSTERECHLCSQVQDPFCGWCTTSGSCSTRDECLTASAALGGNVHWSPFDQIKCSDYQPIVPKFVPLQYTTSGQQQVDVNIRISSLMPRVIQHTSNQWAAQLAQAQFVCHFDYLSFANRSAPMPRLTGATTKAMQAKLNSHTSTIVIGCPLPAPAQRPVDTADSSVDQLRVKLTVRLANSNRAISEMELQQILGLKSSNAGTETSAASTTTGSSGEHQMQQQQQQQSTTSGNVDGDIVREMSFYDCTQHSNCRSCLTAGTGQWSCSWCPLSNRCTFNSSHADFGCAASAVSSISTTPNSLPNPNSNLVRASHLTSSLDEAQASMFGISIDRLNQCPAMELNEEDLQQQQQQQHQLAHNENSVKLGAEGHASRKLAPATSGGQPEILVPHNSRRSIHVPLRQPIPSTNKRVKLECLIEIEGSKAKLSGQIKLINEQQVVACQDNLFTYQEEIATQRAQLTVILSESNFMMQTQNQQQTQRQQHQHQVIEIIDGR